MKKSKKSIENILITHTKKNIESSRNCTTTNEFIKEENEKMKKKLLNNSITLDDNIKWIDTFILQKCDSTECYKQFQSNPILARKYNLTKEYYNLKQLYTLLNDKKKRSVGSTTDDTELLNTNNTWKTKNKVLRMLRKKRKRTPK